MLVAELGLELKPPDSSANGLHYTGYSIEKYGQKSNMQQKPLPRGERIGRRVIVAESLLNSLYVYLGKWR